MIKLFNKQQDEVEQYTPMDLPPLPEPEEPNYYEMSNLYMRGLSDEDYDLYIKGINKMREGDKLHAKMYAEETSEEEPQTEDEAEEEMDGFIDDINKEKEK